MNAVTVQGGRQGRLPLALIIEATSDRAPMPALLWAWLEGRYADVSGEAWPGRKRLADDLGISVDSIDRGLKWLTEHGWLEVEARYDEAGDRTSNLYRLLVGLDRTDAVQVAAPARPPGGRVAAALTTTTAKELAQKAAPVRTQLGRDASEVELHFATDTEKARVLADVAALRDRLGMRSSPSAKKAEQ